jgi:hypothetical protein
MCIQRVSICVPRIYYLHRNISTNQQFRTSSALPTQFRPVLLHALQTSPVFLRQLLMRSPPHHLLRYPSVFAPACSIWYNASTRGKTYTQKTLEILQSIQARAARAICGAYKQPETWQSVPPAIVGNLNSS